MTHPNRGVSSKPPEQALERAVDRVGDINVWFCEECHVYAPATLARDVTVRDAIASWRAEHSTKSPDCKGGTVYIRLTNIDSLRARGFVA